MQIGTLYLLGQIEKWMDALAQLSEASRDLKRNSCFVLTLVILF